MSKDYKYRAAQPRSPSPKSQAPGFLWFISGTLLGAFFIGMVWLKVNPNLLSGGAVTNTSTANVGEGTNTTNIGNAANTGGNVASVSNGATPKNDANQKAADTSKGPDSASPAASQLKFEFADMLKNARVTLPVHDANAPPVKPTQPPPALPPKPHPESNAQDAKNNQDSVPDAPADQPKAATTEPAPKHSTTGHDAAAKSRRSKTKSHPKHTDDEDTPKVAVTKPRVRRHSVDDENRHTDEAKHIEHKEKTRLAKTQRSKPLVLQLGAFNREEDARRLRARMALLGIETEIQQVKTKDNKTIQRLRTSPYSNQDDLEEARQTLNRHNVKTYTTQ